MSKKLLTLTTLAFLTLAFVATTLPAADDAAPSSVKLTAADAAKHDWFGQTVCLDGDHALIGAPYRDLGGSNTGAAYVFTRQGDTWKQQAVLAAEKPNAGAELGRSVCLCGDWAIVGAPLSDERGIDAGSALIFRRDGSNWQQVTQLTASDAKQFSEFGCSVAIHGDHAIVGARVHHDQDNEGNQVSGQVYFFRHTRSAWKETGRFAEFEKTRGGQLGHSVAITDRHAFAGGNTIEGVGVVYVFEPTATGWQPTARLKASDGHGFDTFACSLSAEGDRLIVGSKFDDDDGQNSGSVYVFHHDGSAWRQEAKLTASDAAPGDVFGCSVAIAGKLAVVGAMHADAGANSTGAAYVFRFAADGWKQTTRLTAADTKADDYFGCSVAVDGLDVLLGAKLHDTFGHDAGAAYLFRRSLPLAPDHGKVGVTVGIDIPIGN